MILFKESMVPLILNGTKTVTRRRGRRRWNVGAVHLAYTRPAFARPPGKPFARVRIVSMDYEAFPGHGHARWWSRYMDGEAQREGFSSWDEFLNAYTEINGVSSTGEPCWRVEFTVVDAPPSEASPESRGSDASPSHEGTYERHES